MHEVVGVPSEDVEHVNEEPRAVSCNGINGPACPRPDDLERGTEEAGSSTATVLVHGVSGIVMSGPFNANSNMRIGAIQDRVLAGRTQCTVKLLLGSEVLQRDTLLQEVLEGNDSVLMLTAVFEDWKEPSDPAPHTRLSGFDQQSVYSKNCLFSCCPAKAGDIKIALLLVAAISLPWLCTLGFWVTSHAGCRLPMWLAISFTVKLLWELGSLLCLMWTGDDDDDDDGLRSLYWLLYFVGPTQFLGLVLTFAALIDFAQQIMQCSLAAGFTASSMLVAQGLMSGLYTWRFGCCNLCESLLKECVGRAKAVHNMIKNYEGDEVYDVRTASNCI